MVNSGYNNNSQANYQKARIEHWDKIARKMDTGWGDISANLSIFYSEYRISNKK